MLFIAVVALLVLLVLVTVAVVDLRHRGFKNKKRERGWGGGRSASPPRRWEDLDVAPLCLVLVPHLAVVVAAVCLFLVVGFVAACGWRAFFEVLHAICRMQARTSVFRSPRGLCGE